MTKVLVFDMDGTIADLYKVENWLEQIRDFSARPYEIAKPMYDMDTLVTLVDLLKTQGWTIAITSWLSMESTKEFDKVVRKAKKEWLDRYKFPYDEIHLVKYGTTKAKCTKRLGGYQVLVDDNAEVRASWTLGATINANENILEKLADLLLTEQSASAIINLSRER